jgi:hypothetical protein
MWRFCIIAAAATTILANGYLHGRWTDRWGPSPDLQAAVDKLTRVPQSIGDWHGRNDTLDERAIKTAGIEGYVFRHYENRLKDTTINVLLMCGRSGPLSVHTPDICYAASGYALQGKLESASVACGSVSGPAEFYFGSLSKANATGSTDLRIGWSWGADARWVTSANPRLSFARQAALYKLYVIQQTGPANESKSDQIVGEFLQQLMPVLNDALFRETSDR